MPSPVHIAQEQACLSQILFVGVTLQINAKNRSAIFKASDATPTNQVSDETLSITTPMSCGGIMPARLWLMFDKRACSRWPLPNQSGKFITSGAKCLPIIMSAFAKCAMPQ